MNSVDSSALVWAGVFFWRGGIFSALCSSFLQLCRSEMGCVPLLRKGYGMGRKNHWFQEELFAVRGVHRLLTNRLARGENVLLGVALLKREKMMQVDMQSFYSGINWQRRQVLFNSQSLLNYI